MPMAPVQSTIGFRRRLVDRGASDYATVADGIFVHDFTTSHRERRWCRYHLRLAGCCSL
ncbi:hypothetical protein HAX54_007570, partial [Datura stramonium]|nr:hypothetical protein [Datura stramonium]